MAKIKITLVKSPAGQIPKNKRIIDSLGVRKIGDTREFEKTNALMGALKKVGYLLKIEEK